MKRLALLLLLLLLPSCRTGRIDIYSCFDPCYECEDPCGSCPEGQCVPVPPLGWDGPVLLWSGAPDGAQGCPERAPNKVYEGYAGLLVQPKCPSCACSPATCVLPGLVASEGSACQAGAEEVPYPAPDGWTGACVSPGAVADAAVSSVLFLGLAHAPCEPVESTIVEDWSFGWSTLALACQASAAPEACDETSICVPTSEPPLPGFSQCIFHQGEDVACPPGWPDRQVFHGDIDTSGASCTPCACSAPQGGACRATVEGYSAAGCSGTLIASGLPGLSAPQCIAVEPGYPLASMQATWIDNVPGDCAPSGGEPVGEAKPGEPSTFCCRTD